MPDVHRKCCQLLVENINIMTIFELPTEKVVANTEDSGGLKVTVLWNMCVTKTCIVGKNLQFEHFLHEFVHLSLVVPEISTT